MVNFAHDFSCRQPQELYEITSLIAELMPKLPADGIFAVDALLERPASQTKDQPTWQWRDDRGVWHPYGAVDSRMIEAAHMNGDDEVSLNTLGRTYTIDFPSMQQINEDSGTTRPVQRRFTPSQSGATEPIQVTGRATSANRDARVACLKEERGLAASFIRSLFSVLYEVSEYMRSSKGRRVRSKHPGEISPSGAGRILFRNFFFINISDVENHSVISLAH